MACRGGQGRSHTRPPKRERSCSYRARAFQNTEHNKTQKQHQKQHTTNQKCFTLLCELIYLGFQSSLFEQTQLTVDPHLHYSGPLLLEVKDWDGMDEKDRSQDGVLIRSFTQNTLFQIKLQISEQKCPVATSTFP